MKTRLLKIAGLLSLLLACCCTFGCRTVGDTTAVVALKERAGRDAAVATDCGTAATLAWDTALVAIGNALAARDEAEKAFMKALAVGDVATISRLRKVLSEAEKGAKEARDTAGEIVDHAVSAVAAAKAAVLNAKQINDCQTRRDMKPLMKALQEDVRLARRASKRATLAAGELKKAWLVVTPDDETGEPSVPGETAETK